MRLTISFIVLRNNRKENYQFGSSKIIELRVKQLFENAVSLALFLQFD